MTEPSFPKNIIIYHFGEGREGNRGPGEMHIHTMKPLVSSLAHL